MTSRPRSRRQSSEEGHSEPPRNRVRFGAEPSTAPTQPTAAPTQPSNAPAPAVCGLVHDVFWRKFHFTEEQANAACSLLSDSSVSGTPILALALSADEATAPPVWRYDQSLDALHIWSTGSCFEQWQQLVREAGFGRQYDLATVETAFFSAYVLKHEADRLDDEEFQELTMQYGRWSGQYWVSICLHNISERRPLSEVLDAMPLEQMRVHWNSAGLQLPLPHGYLNEMAVSLTVVPKTWREPYIYYADIHNWETTLVWYITYMSKVRKLLWEPFDAGEYLFTERIQLIEASATQQKVVEALQPLVSAYQTYLNQLQGMPHVSLVTTSTAVTVSLESSSRSVKVLAWRAPSSSPPAVDEHEAEGAAESEDEEARSMDSEHDELLDFEGKPFRPEHDDDFPEASDEEEQGAYADVHNVPMTAEEQAEQAAREAQVYARDREERGKRKRRNAELAKASYRSLTDGIYAPDVVFGDGAEKAWHHDKCYSITFADRYEVGEWFDPTDPEEKAEAADRIIFLSAPVASSRWGEQAFCFTRSRVRQLLKQPTALIWGCGYDGTEGGRSQESLRWLKLPLEEGLDMYVPLKDAVYVVRAMDVKFFQLRPTGIAWPATESLNYVLQARRSAVSGNHCQEGTGIEVSRIRGVVRR